MYLCTQKEKEMNKEYTLIQNNSIWNRALIHI